MALSLSKEPVHAQEVTRLLSMNDPLLAALILAPDDDARRAAVGELLIEHARPVIDRILSRYRGTETAIGAAEAEDIAATVLLRLVRRLQNLADDESEAIASLADFAASLTFNAIYDFLRRRYPERTRLKNRVRYVLSRDRRFRAWSTDKGAVCALATGESSSPSIWRPRRSDERDRIVGAIEHLLVEAGRPVLVDDLVRHLAELWNVVDVHPVELPSDAADPARPHALRLQHLQYLGTLWREILELRGPQRAALLLNLRDADGGNAAELFVRAEIATFDEIAAAMELAPERLTELWSELPLDDLAIAARLGLTRQQVINLRKAARARLARRMGQP